MQQVLTFFFLHKSRENFARLKKIHKYDCFFFLHIQFLKYMTRISDDDDDDDDNDDDEFLK